MSAAVVLDANIGSVVEQSYLFPPFRTDPTNRCLWNGLQRVPLTFKSYSVLMYLICKAGRLVAKDELLDAVWPETFVGEGVLKVCIAEIRKALGDTAQEPRYVQTLHRRGYRFVGKTSKPASSENAPVERGEALSLLHNALKSAGEGKSQIVFVTGEAGIGKTTLVESFLASARLRETVRIAQGQCLDQRGADEPYFALLEALSALTQQMDGEHLAALLRQHAPTWLIELPSLVSSTDREWLSRATIGAAKGRMLRELGALIEALTVEVPLILFLEDLHWSDHATVDAIAHLARRRAPSQLLLIATYRPEELILRDHPLRDLRRDLQLHGQSIELALEFLSEAGVASYLKKCFPGCDQIEPLAHIVHQRTDGNPLLMVNVIDLLQSRTAIGDGKDGWEIRVPIEKLVLDIPRNIQDMVERQFSRTTPEERALLRAAALGMDSEVTRVEECCQDLARRGRWLVSRDPAQETYRFIHELYQRALSRMLAAGERVDFHLRIAEFLESQTSSSETDLAFDLATHFEGARSYSRAVPYLVRCAQISSRRHAAREAVAHLDHAYALLQKLPPHAGSTLKATVLEQRGLLDRSVDDLEGAAANFERMEAFARAAGRRDLEVRALMRSSSVLFWTDHKSCLAAAERAVKLCQELPDPDLLAQAQGYLSSRALRLQGWSDENFNKCVNAVDAARRSKDQDFLGLHLMSLANFYSHKAQYDAACLAADEAMELALAAGDVYHYISCQYFKAWALLHAGQWGAALSLLRTAAHVSELNGHKTAATFCRVLEAWIHIEAFDYEEAGQLAERALAQARSGFLRFLAMIVMGRASIFLGDLGRASSCLASVRASQCTIDWAYNFPLLQATGELCLAQGNYDGARTEAERLTDLARMSQQETYLGIAQSIRSEAMLARDGKAATISGMEDNGSPVARWRLFAVAAKVAAACRENKTASMFAQKSKDTLGALAGSLPADERLIAPILDRIAAMDLA